VKGETELVQPRGSGPNYEPTRGILPWSSDGLGSQAHLRARTLHAVAGHGIDVTGEQPVDCPVGGGGVIRANALFTKGTEAQQSEIPLVLGQLSLWVVGRLR
jgi:hypothetical protein